MRSRVAVGLVALLLVVGIALVVYGQVRPAIDSKQAATIAEGFLAINNGRVLSAESETLSYDGNRPNFPQGETATCWGPSWPFGGCLPYSVWLVHLVGLTPDGQCDAIDVYVDGRTGKVHQFHSADCP